MQKFTYGAMTLTENFLMSAPLKKNTDGTRAAVLA